MNQLRTAFAFSLLLFGAAAYAQVTTIGGGSNCDNYPIEVCKIAITALAKSLDGTTYAADATNGTLRAFSPAGIASTLASIPGGIGGVGDVAVMANGDLFVTGKNTHTAWNVHREGAAVSWQRLAGTGTAGFSGDGGNAAAAMLNFPVGIAASADGKRLYVADNNNDRIRMLTLKPGVDSYYEITTVAGGGNIPCSTTPCSVGDGGPGTLAKMRGPYGIALDAAGNLYIAERVGHRVRKLLTNGVIITLAGTGTVGTSGDGGPATAALLSAPSDVALDVAGNVYVADAGNHRIRRINTDGTISAVAGMFAGLFDAANPLNAQFRGPQALLLTPQGLQVGDTDNLRFRLVQLGAPPTATLLPTTAVPTATRTLVPATATPTKTATAVPAPTCPHGCQQAVP